MAVQPVRIAQVDLRHLPVTPRRRSPVSVRAAAATAASPRAVASPRGTHTSTRPGAQAVRAAVVTPWSSVAPAFRTRLRPAAIVLGVIIVATMLGLVYVTQVLAAQDARYAVDRLLDERQELLRTLGSQEATIVGWGTEAQVTRWAQAQGLHGLGLSVRVKAR